MAAPALPGLACAVGNGLEPRLAGQGEVGDESEKAFLMLNKSYWYDVATGSVLQADERKDGWSGQPRPQGCPRVASDPIRSTGAGQGRSASGIRIPSSSSSATCAATLRSLTDS